MFDIFVLDKNANSLLTSLFLRIVTCARVIKE